VKATFLNTTFTSVGSLTASGSKLSVFGNLSVGSTYGAITASSNGAIFEGDVGIGTTTPTAQFTTTGTVRLSSLTGAGANLVVDSLGNVTVSSDERLKNIQGNFTSSLDQLKGIIPITYKWKPETGYDASSTYSGFSAQNIQANIPEAVTTDAHGFLTLADRPILATVINAIKELSAKVDALTQRFTVGSREKPAGITIYDEATGEPYCIKVVQGNMRNIPGECGTTSYSPPSVGATPTAPTPTVLPDPETTTPTPSVEAPAPTTPPTDPVIQDIVDTIAPVPSTE
jgi:hypothetical protein